jgi:hypothetical protein
MGQNDLFNKVERVDEEILGVLQRCPHELIPAESDCHWLACSGPASGR